MSILLQSNDPYLTTDVNRRIKWDSGNFYRDLWQWDFNPVAGYQCKTYDANNTYQPQYNDAPCAGNDLGVSRAWTKTKGRGVIVAVADSGCNVTHPDFDSQVIGGIAVGGLTEWNVDTNGHGTRVASAVTAKGNNAIGVVGIAPEASLYIIKCAYRSTDVAPIVDAAIAASASVLVMSWGFSDNNESARQALLKAYQHKIMVVCAAFNSPIDEGSQPDYPIQWKLPNVVGVTNNSMDEMPYWSATSNSLLHLYAPGRLIVVTNPQGTDYVYSSGTSFSTPKVAGALTLIQAAFPNLPLTEKIDRLLAAVDRLPQYTGKTITGGRLNVGWAVTGPELSIQTIIPNDTINPPSTTDS